VEMAANLEERDSQAMRSARATVPSGASADRDSWVAGFRPAAHSQLGRIPAKMRAELTSAEIATSGSYFDDVLLDPRRYGIKNTTDKMRRPGAVRRRRDAVCSERAFGKPEVCRVISVDAKSPPSRSPECEPHGRIVALSDRCFSVFDWEMTGTHREPGHDGRNWPGSGELSLRLTDGVDFTNLAHRSRTQESIRRDGLLFGRYSD
jgi:hypothetical protein